MHIALRVRFIIISMDPGRAHAAAVHDVTARTTFCNIGPPFHYLKKRPYIHDLTFAFFVPNSFGSWQIFCIENLWFVEKGSVSCVCSERMVYHMTSLLK